MEWRTVMSSSPSRTSRTTSRAISWRCSIVRCVGVGGEAGAERVERFGELEVGLGVVQLGVERVQLDAQGRLTPAQLGHAGAELFERDQLLLVAVDQSAAARSARG